MDAIPIPDAAPIVAVPGDEDRLRSLISGTGAQSIIPKVLSNRGIPVTPQTQGRPIPVDRATGETEQLNDQGKPIAPGIAGLWAHAENIHNPFLRTLGKIGAVGARAIDVAGSVAAPGVMAQIPGTALNQKVEENRAEKRQTQDTANAATQARTAYEQAETSKVPTDVEHEKAETDALRNPKPEKPEDLNQQYADSVADAVKRGVNPLQDPTVQKFADAITQLQKQPQSTQESLDKQYNDAIKAGDHEAAQRILKVKSDLARAGQTPQRPPQITMVVPGANGTQTLETLRPGQQVPTGALTPQQFGPQQTKTQAATNTANATISSFERYQKSFRDLSPKLTDNDREAMQVLTSHQGEIAQNLIEGAGSGLVDALVGQPLTGYSTKLMQGAMTKEQFDKLSPAGKKMLADYFHAILANFANMKQRLGTAGGRNQAMVQAEMNAIPLPYIDSASADAMFNDTLSDIRSLNPGSGQQQGGGQRRVIDLTH